MASFCPRCHYPLDDDPHDDSRLCLACRWFGDKSETDATPPPPDSLELAFLQLLALYRDVCRLELLAEQIAKDIPEHVVKFNAIKERVLHAGHCLLFMFRGQK